MHVKVKVLEMVSTWIIFKRCGPSRYIHHLFICLPILCWYINFWQSLHDRLKFLVTWLGGYGYHNFISIIVVLILIISLVILSLTFFFFKSDEFMVLQVFGITDDPEPRLEGHVFPNPVDTKGYMIMLVYKNASLTREGTAGPYFLCTLMKPNSISPLWSQFSFQMCVIAVRRNLGMFSINIYNKHHL